MRKKVSAAFVLIIAAQPFVTSCSSNPPPQLDLQSTAGSNWANDSGDRVLEVVLIDVNQLLSDSAGISNSTVGSDSLQTDGGQLQSDASQAGNWLIPGAEDQYKTILKYFYDIGGNAGSGSLDTEQLQNVRAHLQAFQNDLNDLNSSAANSDLQKAAESAS